MPSLNLFLKELIHRSLGSALTKDRFEQTPKDRLHPFTTVQFHRQSPDHVRLIDVQRDKYWTNHRGRFTINVGLYFPAVEREAGKAPITGIPSAGYWTVSTRLGQLAHGEDRWWTISPEADDALLSEELRQTWLNVGKPWLDKHAELAAARDWLVDDGDIWTAILASSVLGNRRETTALMKRFLIVQRNPDLPILNWAKERDYLTNEGLTRLKWGLIQDVKTATKTVEEVFDDLSSLKKRS